ncbi:hypothetical protein ACFX1X_041691 [Malus domestica]
MERADGSIWTSEVQANGSLAGSTESESLCLSSMTKVREKREASLPLLTLEMMYWMEGVETSSRFRSCHGYTSILSSRFCKFLQLSDPIRPENWTA